MKGLCFNLTVLLALLFAASAGYGQENTHAAKIADFLKTDLEVRTDSNEWQFTGKFMSLNPQLEHDLLNSFSGHRFWIAEMRFVGHIPPSDYPLIVITDAISGEVVGFVRHLNWGLASKSFTNLFTNYHADNKEDLERKLLVLGALVASTDQRGSVGSIKRKKKALSVDLLWGGAAWRKLQAEYDSAFRIRRMTLLNASQRRGFF